MSYPVSIDGYNGNYSVDVSNIGPFDLSDNGDAGVLTVTEDGVTEYGNGTLNVTDASLSITGSDNLSPNLAARGKSPLST